MPSTGFYLFLPVEDGIEEAFECVCQCPQRASTYFFEEKNYQQEVE